MSILSPTNKYWLWPMVCIYLNDRKQKIFSNLAQQVVLHYLSNDTQVEILGSKLTKQIQRSPSWHSENPKTSGPMLLKSRPISATFRRTPIIRSLKWSMADRHNRIVVLVGIFWYSEIKDDKDWGEMERYGSWWKGIL